MNKFYHEVLFLNLYKFIPFITSSITNLRSGIQKNVLMFVEELYSNANAMKAAEYQADTI